MTISNKGLELIKTYEGLKLQAYPDPATGDKPYTIGYGSTHYPDGSFIQPTDTITKELSEQMLISHLNQLAPQILKLLSSPINQNQLDALCSFTYNEGIGNLKTSTLLKRVNQKEYNLAAGEFDKWVYAGGKKLMGLVNRRKAEKELFLS